MNDSLHKSAGMSSGSIKSLYLYPGLIFASAKPHRITTVLGSCVSVCLWDKKKSVGGINHFLLPLWNGEGLPSPRYGNIAIQKLIERMLTVGCRREDMVAKVFGGATIMNGASPMLSVGGRNTLLAQDMLGAEGIEVVSQSVGGSDGRKIIFDTSHGEVLMKRVSARANHRQGSDVRAVTNT